MMVRRAMLALVLASGSAAASDPLADWPVLFVRGDALSDGTMDLSDALSVLGYLFLDGAPPPCLKAADANDDGRLDLADPIGILWALFMEGGSLPAPAPGCGPDPTEDGLPCGACPRCEFESLVAAYGILETVAGTGLSQNTNEWLPSFEGGPAAQAELSNPHMTQGDAAGNLFIADKEAHAIRKITPDGRIHTAAGTNQAGNGADTAGPATERALDSPNGIWVKPDSTVYILDLGNSKVRRLDPSGTLTTLFTDPSGIALGRGLWVRDDEQLAYVSSGRDLKRWTPGGGVQVLATGFKALGNLAVDPQGRLVVTDRGLHKVSRIGEDGSMTVIAGSGSIGGGGDGRPALQTGLYGVRGIWFLPNGGYFLATHEDSQVWYVDTLGSIHLFLDGIPDGHSGDGEHFRTPGYKVSEVRAVTVDPVGDVLVTENDLGYVRRVRRK